MPQYHIIVPKVKSPSVATACWHAERQRVNRWHDHNIHYHRVARKSITKRSSERSEPSIASMCSMADQAERSETNGVSA